jgi:hypothetical protein
MKIHVVWGKTTYQWHEALYQVCADDALPYVLWHRPPKYGTDNLKDKPLTAVDQHTTLLAYRNCWQETGVGHAKNLSDT